ncbi:hypothetical protein EVAR_78460_1 [Eumeta japonica]|uniref:Uncharacterized protein n=1 Tax=Eumeta variegata TaxID=151549 RepID=A0A4C1TY58_EUMVA|nr:hypothetical protein EVAR_78460_1 [Eumeta japonica]
MAGNETGVETDRARLMRIGDGMESIIFRSFTYVSGYHDMVGRRGDTTMACGRERSSSLFSVRKICLVTAHAQRADPVLTAENFVTVHVRALLRLCKQSSANFIPNINVDRGSFGWHVFLLIFKLCMEANIAYAIVERSTTHTYECYTFGLLAGLTPMAAGAHWRL